MKLESFLQATRDRSVIDTRNLPEALRDPAAVRVQISRWVKSGKLLQLCRGLYVWAEPFRKVEVYPYYVAALLQRPSYISREKALEYHDLIPESVSIYTSVTTKRTMQVQTPVGRYDYCHVKPSLFWGYQSVRVNRETAFIAVPEKALLDLMYFYHGKITQDYVEELRLQNLEKVDVKELMLFAKKFSKPKMLIAARQLVAWIQRARKGEKTL